MSHPLRPCQERQGEDGLPPVADAGNQQGQGLDGGEFASYPDAKLESHRLRRRQGKYILRHEEQLPEQSKVDKLRTALQARAGGWKALIDAEEILKKISTNRLVSTRPVPTWDPSDAQRPPALRVL
jgi:hypothetical protein